MASKHQAGGYLRDIEIGNEPPLVGGGRKRAPDRREVSLRWLGGTTLTGLTSTLLMGAALFAALDGRELLATPAEVATSEELGTLHAGDLAVKGSRVIKVRAPRAQPTDRRRMNVSTVTRVGDSEVIRTRPFEQVKIALAAARKTDRAYPAFNPLNIYSDGTGPEVAADDSQSIIYGASVETEVAIRVADFDFETDIASGAALLSDDEAENIVRSTAAILTDGSVQLASLHYVDPLRFGIDDPGLAAGLGLAAPARIIPQNMSVAARRNGGDADHPVFEEDLIEVNAREEIADVLEATGYGLSSSMAEAIETLLKTRTLKPGYAIRLGLQNVGDREEIVRASVYYGSTHQLTIALNDRRQYVPAPEPVDPGIMTARGGENAAPVIVSRDLPSVYDAIYRSVLSYDLPERMAAQIVRMVAADVDFRSPVRPTDRLELFFSVPEDDAAAEQERELLFVEANFGGTTRSFYRFRASDGTVDYFDEEGRSARQFLLRKPVPNGVFRSPFGKRRHPILGYTRMHWGVDWAAPRGTPIIAPGDGTVVKAGWSNGYGKQTVIRHANGYETSYSHQTAFAKGIKPGVRVRQGQVIGYVGSTGLSTGPHLHYEMKVNGTRVDPMRVRLPNGKVLEGEDLAAFERERDRINALLGKDDGTVVARADG
ncbi:M23 family metallopeptidase [Oricola thermophila]|uniref:M23 family metallopeptidase n=1 Tax=Oricola thermophila TaxID=2742145 RepID=A0A6N1VIN6_9HYPH|nr:M23 family metallopeptidase [Oricola thermophila]QKV20293.1 M23 family metallopeptidase [Oricola thermophila]